MRRLLMMLVFLTIVLSIWGGMHRLVYTHLALRTGLSHDAVIAIGVVLALLAAITFLSILRVFPKPIAGTLWTLGFSWAGFVFLLFFIFLAGDIVFGIARLVNHPADPLLFARIEAASALAIALILAGFAWMGAHGDVPVRKVEVTLDRFPKALSGFRIVQVTDLHVSPDTHVESVQRLVDRVNALKPDLIAVTGDLVDGSPEILGPLVAPLKDLHAPRGVFFVTGNHEYFSNADRWIDHVKTLGFRVLQNDRVEIAGADGFDLAGVPDWMGPRYGEKHTPRLRDTLAGRAPAREVVLLAHQPKQFDEAATLDVGLQLSGHTHGGQIWPFTWLIHIAERRVAGLFREGRSQLYVSRGTGFWGPPMRLGSRWELTDITLKAAS